ncbi:U6 snRNA-associated Sm-like protein LSm5 [Diutina catenulata]
MDAVLPLEVIDKAIGKNVNILMTSEKEFTGTLVGFDDFVNMVLENVKEIDGVTESAPRKKMLLNGGHVAMIVIEK